jgi:hypothetical protein
MEIICRTASHGTDIRTDVDARALSRKAVSTTPTHPVLTTSSCENDFIIAYMGPTADDTGSNRIKRMSG